MSGTERWARNAGCRVALTALVAIVGLGMAGPADAQTASSFWRSSLGAADGDFGPSRGLVPDAADRPTASTSLAGEDEAAAERRRQLQAIAERRQREAARREAVGLADDPSRDPQNARRDGLLAREPRQDTGRPTPLAPDQPQAAPSARAAAIDPTVLAQDAPPTGLAARAGAAGRERAASAQAPDPNPRRIAEEANPYAAPGLRLGTIRVLPTLGLYGGAEWSESEGDGEARPFSEIEPGLRLESDWSRHAATLDVTARGRIGPDDDLETNYDVSARALGRLDIGPTALGTDTTLTLRLNASEEVGESTVTALPGADGLNDLGGLVGSVVPLDRRDEAGRQTTLEASLGLDHELGRVGLGLAGAAEWTDESAGQDATTLRLTARASYAGAQASPFVEGSLAQTRYCETCTGDFDAAGALVGLRLREDRRLGGEVAIGYELRREVDGGATETGLIWRGSLDYELTPLITLDLTTRATLGDANDAASRTLALGLTHRARRWLTLTGGLALTWEDVETITDGLAADGTARTLTASLGAAYRLNRFATLNADLSQERNADGTGAETVENTVRLGVTLAR